MFWAFQTSMYRNLYMTQPILWSDSVSYITGTCGAGKTNLCIALGDLLRDKFSEAVESGSSFYYCFLYDNTKIIYTYERRMDGAVGNAVIEIADFQFFYRSENELVNPSDIFREIQLDTNEQIEKKINDILKKCNEEIETGFQFIVQDRNGFGERFQSSKDYDSKERSEQEEFSAKKKIVVWDDSDVGGQQPFRKRLKEIKTRNQQLIVVTRRSGGIDDVNLDDCYYIEQGNIKKVTEWSNKDIKSVVQYKNMIKKGIF